MMGSWLLPACKRRTNPRCGAWRGAANPLDRRHGGCAPGRDRDAEAGDALDGIYACVRKDRLTARTGRHTSR